MATDGIDNLGPRLIVEREDHVDVPMLLLEVTSECGVHYLVKREFVPLHAGNDSLMNLTQLTLSC